MCVRFASGRVRSVVSPGGEFYNGGAGAEVGARMALGERPLKTMKKGPRARSGGEGSVREAARLPSAAST